MSNCWLVCLVLIVTAGTSRAETIHVPSDQPTLSAAVSVAMPGDEIVLDEGVFEGSVAIDFLDITIRGAGRHLTTIVPAAGGPQGSVIAILPGAGGPTPPGTTGRVSDLTISGYAGGDPELQSSYRSPLEVRNALDGTFELERVAITETYLPNSNCVLLFRLGAVSVVDCIFDEVSGEGGSLDVYSVDAVRISRCVFERNGGYTSPLSVFDTSDLLIQNCLWSGTSSMTPNGRAAVTLRNCLGLVQFCTFGKGGPDPERIDGTFGHIDIRNSNVLFEDCAFTEADYLIQNINSAVQFWDCVGVQLPPNGGNTLVDPGFVDHGSPGPDGLWRTADDNPGDLTPAPGSVLIDSNFGGAFSAFDSDVLGNLRLIDNPAVPNASGIGFGYIDVGAIERQDGNPACPSDTNGDSNTDPADFTAWVNAFNNNLPQCDQNGDGSCTPTDFTAWITNFNAGC